MAYNFPDAPTKGQTTTAPSGVSYVWDSVKWMPTTGAATTAYAPITSPVFLGDPQVPTASTGDADTSIASTAFVFVAATNAANTAAGLRVLKTGDSMSGPLTVNSTITTTGAVGAGGNGVYYPTLGFTHPIAFNWDGTWIRPYVDNTLVGAALATYTWSNNTFLPLVGGTLNNGGNDPLTIWGGPYGRIRYYSPGQRDWRAGVDNIGRFAISDETAGRYVLYMDTGGSTYTTGQLVSGTAVFAYNDGNFGIIDDGSTRFYKFTANAWLGSDVRSTESCSFSRYTNVIMGCRSDNILADYVGYVAGVGAYANWSDAGLKTDIEDADIGGLAAVRKLRPRRFNRKPGVGDPVHSPPPRQGEVGFVAQEVREVIPDAVVELAVSKGLMPIDTETALAVQLDPIVAALVNAMKEMAARIESLEAKLC